MCIVVNGRQFSEPVLTGLCVFYSDISVYFVRGWCILCQIFQCTLSEIYVYFVRYFPSNLSNVCMYFVRKNVGTCFLGRGGNNEWNCLYQQRLKNNGRLVRVLSTLELGNLRKGDHGSVAGKKPVFDSLSSYLLVLPARGKSVVVSCGLVSLLSWRCYHVFVI